MPPLALGTRVLRPSPRPSVPECKRTFTTSYNLFGTDAPSDAPEPAAPAAGPAPGAPAPHPAPHPAGGARTRTAPALRLDVRHLDAPGGAARDNDTGGGMRPTPGGPAIAHPGDSNGAKDAQRVLCESPAALEASDDEVTPRPTVASTPIHTTPTPASTPTRKLRRAASFTFGDSASYSPEITARASALAFSAAHTDTDNRDALTDFVPLNNDLCATPKSILKKKDTGSIMSRNSSVLSFRTEHAPRKRVTWSDQGSLVTLSTTKSKRSPSVRLSAGLGNMGRALRRNSTDAATLLRRAAGSVAGSVASAGNAIPGIGFFRQPWDYYYPPSDDDEPPRVRPASPDIDWIAAGRAYTEEDLDRDFPPLSVIDDDSLRIPSRRERKGRGRRGDLDIRGMGSGSGSGSLARARSAPVRSRLNVRTRAPSDASDASEDSSEPSWDARRFTIPVGVLASQFIPRGPVFEEPDEDVRANPNPLDWAASSTAAETTAATLRPPASRNASTTSDDTLPSLDSSFSSLESEASRMPGTPPASVLVQPPTPESERPIREPRELDGVVVIPPRPTKAWPRPPVRAYTAW